jgi:Protein of unknown function (DUF3168)
VIEGQRAVAVVFGALAADAPFWAAIGGRLFRDQVPSGAALPAAIVTLVSSVDSRTLDGRRVLDTVTIDVHLVADGSSYGPIDPAADLADGVVDGLRDVVDGVLAVRFRRDAVTAFLENESGATYAHLIQTYRSEAYALP